MSPYEYEHLGDDRRIRLLSLLPAHDTTDPLRCQLQVHSLTEDSQIPQYTALSYVWGNRDSDISIECNGGILFVTRNCFQALRLIRDVLRNSNRQKSFSPYLWIDSICINQSDNQEKSTQIRLMKDIYYLAETVLCFMEDSYSYDGLHGSNRLEKMSVPRWESFSRTSRASINWTIGRNISSGDVNQREVALRRLSESKYWTRLWTFQEALLSPRKICFSGTDMIEWESVGPLLQEATAMKYGGFHQSLPTAMVFHTLTTTSPMLHLLLGGKRAVVSEKLNETFTQSLSLEISRILSFSSELKTTDPRDKVYALVGLMAALDIDLKIDYSRPVALIYADNRCAFSKKLWSSSKWQIKPEGVSYAVLIDVPTPNQSTTAALGKRMDSVREKKANWSEDDDYTTSTTSPLSPNEMKEGDYYTSLVHSLVTSLLRRRRNWLISKASAKLGPVIRQCSPSEKNDRDRQASSGANDQAKGQEKFTESQSIKIQNTRKDKGDHSDDEGEKERPKKKSKGNDMLGVEKLLACPFYQRDPSRPSVHRSCAGPGWASISRLKEHLYRTHFAHRCRRCRARFHNASELDSHYQNPIPCRASSITTDPMEGFCDSQRDSLKSRRMQDWKQIYQILFPDDDERYIPPEYYSSVITITDILDQFESHYQAEAERLLPRHLGPILDGSSSPPRADIQNEILTMISDIHRAVIQSFRQRMIGMIVDNTPPTHHRNFSTTAPSRIEPNLDNPASYFLEYFNNLQEDESVFHFTDTNSGLDLNDFQNSAVLGQDYTMLSPLPKSTPGSYDERVNNFTVIETPNTNDAATAEQALNTTENHTGGWSDEWTLLNNLGEAGSTSDLTTQRRDNLKDCGKRNTFERR